MKAVRLLSFTIAAALAVALLVAASARPARAEEGIWQTDFKAALAKAKAEKKYVLADFTGSDWCGWCMKLHGEVFDKEPFKTAAPKQYVLVELDYPRKKELSEDLKKQNEELRLKYKIQGFPTVLLMDAEGQVIAHTGYREGGPEEYLKQLADFGKTYENVVALKAKLDAVKGLDRAKLLDQIVEGYHKLNNESDEVAAWSKEIIALDPDNKAGLKVKYEFPMQIAEAEKLAQSGDVAEAKELIDKALALKGVPAEMRQDGYMTKAQLCLTEHKFDEVVATLKTAKEIAPESPKAKHIDAYIKQFTKLAEAQEAIKKLEAELAKSEGLDRAKLLDKLVDAQQKLPMDAKGAEKIEKMTKEIIALDADNKAGLKKKYQFKATLADAVQLARSGKTDEASAAVDKALETPGISGEDTQRGLFLKAQICLSERNMAEGVKLLKKALEAAPKSDMAPVLEQLIAQFEKTKKPVKQGDE